MINLIILAMEEELNGVLSQLTNVKTIDDKYAKLYEFKINDEKYIMTLGKIGKVSTALFIGYLSAKYSIKRIFNVGTSGALNNDLHIGDVVVADEIMYHDVDVTGFNYKMGQVPKCPLKFNADKEYIASKKIKAENYSFKVHKGLIISGDTFINKTNYKKINSEILKDALCCEMESGSVAQCCYHLQIPFVIIRSISDVVTKENNDKTFDDNLNEVAINSGKVLLDLISEK